MDRLTVEQVEADFDAIMGRVEAGESFIIQSEHGDAMLIPHKFYEELDELVRIHTDHEEGC
jgi:hypothetical protein